MRLYRLEHPSDGKGPYVSSVAYYGLGREMAIAHDDGKHPGPCDFEHFERFKEGYTHGFFFACTSPNALRAWFGKYFYRLLKLGFQVKVYDTHNYYVGKSGIQAIFQPGRGS